MSTSAIHQNRSRSARRWRLPSLLNGDHLSAPEFERRYQAMPGRDLACRSRVFPGLCLHSLSMVVGKGGDKGVFRTLNKGLKSLEHKAFVQKLAKS